MPEKNSRREFLKRSATAVGALSFPASSYARIVGANSIVRTGVIGYSDRFREALFPAFLKHAGSQQFEIAALSDIWKRRRDEGVALITESTGHHVALCRNNDELYDRKDIDAVIIATADFQHAQHGIEAVHNNLDAYVEKPMAHTMEDAREFRKAVRQAGRKVQIGTQRRSARNYQRAKQFIQSGQFGNIVGVEMTWNVNQPGRWRRPQLVNQLKEEDTDWKRFLINRPAVPFDARKYLEFRLFWPYSSGIPDQWMVHQIDTVHWFADLPRPRSVVANGGIYMWKDGRQNWDTLTAVFDYGPLDDPTKGFEVIYSSRQTNSAGDVKELYRSNSGTLDLDKNVISGEGGLDEGVARAMGMKGNRLQTRDLIEGASAVETNSRAGVDEATSANMLNWMQCVRGGKTPNADIEAGYSHSIALCMTIAAIQTGERVTFDDATQEVMAGGKVWTGA